jgi:hypothetical protein
MIPLPLKPVLGIFSHHQVAYDTVGQYVGPRWQVTQEPDYNFFGSVQPSSPRDLQLLPQGDITGGEVTVYSDKKLFFSSSDESGGTGDRQTFIRYRNVVYRVLVEADWIIHTGHYVYIARRYVER